MDPGMNGRQTYEHIIEIHPSQKAVIASGFSESEDVYQAQKLGARGFIRKPYTMEQLGRTIKEEMHR
jgi:DNA-binding NarL/FixJ family response regulator